MSDNFGHHIYDRIGTCCIVCCQNDYRGVTTVFTDLDTLMMGLFPMFDARSANLRVETVSSNASPEGDMVEITVV